MVSATWDAKLGQKSTEGVVTMNEPGQWMHYPNVLLQSSRRMDAYNHDEATQADYKLSAYKGWSIHSGSILFSTTEGNACNEISMQNTRIYEASLWKKEPAHWSDDWARTSTVKKEPTSLVFKELRHDVWIHRATEHFRQEYIFFASLWTIVCLISVLAPIQTLFWIVPSRCQRWNDVSKNERVILYVTQPTCLVTY